MVAGPRLDAWVPLAIPDCFLWLYFAAAVAGQWSVDSGWNESRPASKLVRHGQRWTGTTVELALVSLFHQGGEA